MDITNVAPTLGGMDFFVEKGVYMRRLTILLLLTFLISGCASVRPPPPAQRHSEKVFQKSYVIGADAESFVGDSIVKLKDYMLITTALNAVVPTSTFSASIGSQQVEFSPQQKHTVIAYVENEGEQQRLILFQPNSQVMHGSLGLSIRSDGSISKKIFIFASLGWGAGVIGEVAVSNSARMENAVLKEVDVHALFENHELIYNGTDGKSIFITYREFTSNDLARPAFYQNLTYDMKSEMIRFKKYKIKVFNTDNEKIRFSVLEDGR